MVGEQSVDEVAGTFEKLNKTKAALEKAEDRIAEFENRKVGLKDDYKSLELEVAKRGNRILAVEREVMGKNIEIAELEKESVGLVKTLAARDKRLVHLETDLGAARAETVALQRKVADAKASAASMAAATNGLPGCPCFTSI